MCIITWDIIDREWNYYFLKLNKSLEVSLIDELTYTSCVQKEVDNQQLKISLLASTNIKNGAEVASPLCAPFEDPNTSVC